MSSITHSSYSLHDFTWDESPLGESQHDAIPSTSSFRKYEPLDIFLSKLDFRQLGSSEAMKQDYSSRLHVVNDPTISDKMKVSLLKSKASREQREVYSKQMKDHNSALRVLYAMKQNYQERRVRSQEEDEDLQFQIDFIEEELIEIEDDAASLDEALERGDEEEIELMVYGADIL